MSKAADEYRMVQILEDALSSIRDDCGCVVTSCEMTEDYAHINFRFHDEPYRIVIEKLGPVGTVREPSEARPARPSSAASSKTIQ